LGGDLNVRCGADEQRVVVIAMFRDERAELFRQADESSAEVDALLEWLRARRELIEKQASANELVFKTTETPVRQVDPADDVILSDETTVLATMIGELQAQIDALEARVAQLEADADNSAATRVLNLSKVRVKESLNAAA